MGTEIEDHIVQKYEIKKRLGKGAYGIVWKVADKKTKQILALKKIFDAFRNRTDAQRTFREIMFLMAFGDHSNIIKLHNVFQAFNNKDIYLVFEFMETDLHNVIKKGDILQDIHMRFIMYQLFKALKYLHSGNVIHRDLKPSNVLLNSECHVKMCDFGLARSLSQIPVDEEGSPNLTEYIATRWYRAPEILLASHRYTSGIDQWSMGCILGEMFLGKPLFPGSSTLNQLERIMSIIDKPSPKDIESMQSDYGATVSETTSIIHKSLEELFPTVEPNGFRMLKQLLQFNPDKRLSADQALKHSYLSKFHKPSEEIAMDHEVLPMLDDAVQLSLDEYRDKLYALISEGKLQLDWTEKKKINKDTSDISNLSAPPTNNLVKEDENSTADCRAKRPEGNINIINEDIQDINAKNVNKSCEDDNAKMVKEDNKGDGDDTIRCDDKQSADKELNHDTSETAVNGNEVEDVTLRGNDEISEKSDNNKCDSTIVSNSELLNLVESNEPMKGKDFMENSNLVEPLINSIDSNKSDVTINNKHGHNTENTTVLENNITVTECRPPGSDAKMNPLVKCNKSKSTSILHSKQHVGTKSDNHKLLPRDNSLNKDVDAKPRWVISTTKNKTSSYSENINDCLRANSNNINNNKSNIKIKKTSLKENNSESLNNLNRNSISKTKPVSGFKMLKEQNYSKSINKVSNTGNLNQKSFLIDDHLMRRKYEISQSQFHPLLRTKKYANYSSDPSSEKTAKNLALTKNTAKNENEKIEDKKWATFKPVARPKSKTIPLAKRFNANISSGNPDAKPPRPNPPRHTSAPAATKNFTALRIEPMTSSKFLQRRNRAVSSHAQRNIDHNTTNESATILTKPPRFLPFIKTNIMPNKERWAIKPA